MKPLILTGLFAAILLLVLSPICFGQDNKPSPSPNEKAEQIVQRGLQAVGGDRYLQVKTLIGRGFFTDYHDGVSGIPVKFIDYISYPDKERTDFAVAGPTTHQTSFS